MRPIGGNIANMSGNDANNRLTANIAAQQAMHAQLAALGEPLSQAAVIVRDALLGGRKVLCCGNGGSAADCAHLTAELAGRFAIERRGYQAIDLTANNSLLTALANDYDADQVFAKQVEALGGEGDVLIAISTSGNSANILAAIKAGNTHKLHTIAMLGKGGGKCKGLSTIDLIAPSDVTARVQEAHLLLYHTLCEAIDEDLAR